MVKRDDIKAGVLIKVAKEMKNNAAPPSLNFKGRLALHERLEVQGKPFTTGGLNFVRVKRTRTGEVFDVIYSYVTNFCSLVHADDPPPEGA